MKYKVRIICLFNAAVFIAAALPVFAQAHAVSEQGASASPDALIKAAGVIMLVWIGIALYLFFIDRKVSRLEKELNEK